MPKPFERRSNAFETFRYLGVREFRILSNSSETFRTFRSHSKLFDIRASNGWRATSNAAVMCLAPWQRGSQTSPPPLALEEFRWVVYASCRSGSWILRLRTNSGMWSEGLFLGRSHWTGVLSVPKSKVFIGPGRWRSTERIGTPRLRRLCVYPVERIPQCGLRSFIRLVISISLCERSGQQG